MAFFLVTAMKTSNLTNRELFYRFCSLIRACTVLQDEQTKRHNTESLLDTGKDGFLEVYVSAVENPGRFWVQVS
jgi:hypothetical protein